VQGLGTASSERVHQGDGEALRQVWMARCVCQEGEVSLEAVRQPKL